MDSKVEVWRSVELVAQNRAG